MSDRRKEDRGRDWPTVKPGGVIEYNPKDGIPNINRRSGQERRK